MRLDVVPCDAGDASGKRGVIINTECDRKDQRRQGSISQGKAFDEEQEGQDAQKQHGGRYF